MDYTDAKVVIRIHKETMKLFRLICFTAFLALLCSCHNLDPFASKGGADNTIGFYCNGEKYIQFYETGMMGAPMKHVYTWREDNDILLFTYLLKEAYPHDGMIEALGFRIPEQRQYYEGGEVIHLSGDQMMVICKRTQIDNDSSSYEEDDEYRYYFHRLSPSSQRQYLFPVDATIKVKRHANNLLTCDFEITGYTEEQEGGETVQLTKGIFGVQLTNMTEDDRNRRAYHILHERYCDYIGQYYDKP